MGRCFLIALALGSGLAAVPIWDAATLRTFTQLKQVAYHLQHGFATTKLAFLDFPSGIYTDRDVVASCTRKDQLFTCVSPGHSWSPATGMITGDTVIVPTVGISGTWTGATIHWTNGDTWSFTGAEGATAPVAPQKAHSSSSSAAEGATAPVAAEKATAPPSELATASSDDNLVVKAMTFHSCAQAANGNMGKLCECWKDFAPTYHTIASVPAMASYVGQFKDAVDRLESPCGVASGASGATNDEQDKLMAFFNCVSSTGGTNKAKLCKCIDEAQHDTALWARITGVVGADEVRNDVEQCAAVRAPIAVSDAVKEAEEAGAVAAEVKEEDAERTTEKAYEAAQHNPTDQEQVDEAKVDASLDAADGALMTEEKLLKHEDSTPQSDEDALHVEEEDEDHDVEATEHDEEAAEREEEEEEKAVGTPIAANDAVEEAEEADAVKEAQVNVQMPSSGKE